ncbi:NAD-dependent deacylase [Sporosarcina sp. HYO08]|uniref:NAD-dependent deacylase n=1 Tax=Sporosarcina sp. HYO08 TaxID=1759557 RepID=UPI00079663BC|nr:NAD-dependent deacylase [Sporosarcina sp. HYO08]KXH87123.1 NAD-dependent deacetylase [Sporosarcina sp. HYO08]
MLTKLLKNAKRTIVYTGAGMSTESGLPDFRSAKKGLWEVEDPSQVASTDALNRDVERFFQFYRKRVLGVKDCQPHEGYRILADWEKQGVIRGIITQNVDGFHSVAGSQNIMELHGTLQQIHCQSCGQTYSNDRYEEEVFYCECGGKLRPSVVLFGEGLPEEPFMKAIHESEQADLFIVLGSSLTVSPANQFPILAKDSGAKLVIVNLEPTQFDHYADLVINDRKIGEVLAEVDRNIVNT